LNRIEVVPADVRARRVSQRRFERMHRLLFAGARCAGFQVELQFEAICHVEIAVGRPALVCENDLLAITPDSEVGNLARHFYNNLQESHATKDACTFAGTHLGTLSPADRSIP
jgi:hypothetical protein